MSGLLLDGYTGKVRGPDVAAILGPNGQPLTMEENYKRGWRGAELSDTRPYLDQLPDHIQELLAKSSGKVGPFAGMQQPRFDKSMYEVLRYWIVADTSITAAAEAIMVPAFNFYNSEMQVGTGLHYTLIGSHSEAATPGTFIFRMRWGGVGGALQVTSATLTPSNTAAATTNGFVLEFWGTVRTVGAAGTAWWQGHLDMPSLLLAAATGTQISTYLLNLEIPATGAAVGAATDFTAALGPSPTYQPSLGTATLTTHLAFLECMN